MHATQHGSHPCRGGFCHSNSRQPAWSCPPFSMALVTAARILQEHPHLASAPAVNSSSSSSRCNAVFHSSHAKPHMQQQQWQEQQQQQQQQLCLYASSTRREWLFSSWQIHCLPDTTGAIAEGQTAAPAAAATTAGDVADATGLNRSPAAAEVRGTADETEAGEANLPASKDAAAAAAALARLQQLSQKLQQTGTASPHCSSAAAVSATSGFGSSSSSSSSLKVPCQHQQPIRPAQDREAVLQQIEQQGPSQADHLLTWRSRSGRTSQQQPLQQQQLAQQQQQQQHLTTTAASAQQWQQQQHSTLTAASAQQHSTSTAAVALPLEPSIGPGGKTYITSPVSFVAANTSTKALAGSVSTAFAVHSHQLMFAVGPLPLSVCLKALATSRVMLAADNGGQPVDILMQPTLRGGRTVRNQSYALDIARVGELPMQPGGSGSSSSGSVVYGQQQQQGNRQSGSNASEQQQQQQQQQGLKTDVKMVHITSASNELAAARSLVENMPARGQTVIRVAGPFASETAVLAVALARPLFRQKYGQDLAMLVTWNENRMYKNKQSGLLLAVFRCAVGVFPPEVLLLPPSQRNLKRQQYWQQQRQWQSKRQSEQQKAVSQ